MREWQIAPQKTKKTSEISGVFVHGQGRDRTGDTWIFSPLLYQLSYLPGKDLRRAGVVPTRLRSWTDNSGTAARGKRD